MEGFSEFFTFNELTDSDRHPQLVPKNREEAKAFIESGRKLSKLLEEVRGLLGNRPMTITSGFRGDTLNKAVGSKAKSSKHLKFEAADFVHSTLTPEKCFNILLKNIDKLPSLRKVILESVKGSVWIHLEVKTSEADRVSFWTTTNGTNFQEVKV